MSKATARNVDFSNVKDGGNFNRNRIPAGDYLALISKVEDAEAKDGVFQYLFSIKLKNRPSSVFPYYCKLQENQLWKLRNLFIAAGMTIPKKKLKVDPNRLIGKLIGVTIEDDEYEGKEQSQVAGVFPAAELAELDVDEDDVEDEEDEEADDDLDMEEDEDEAGPYAHLDRNELKAAIKEYQSDFQARKSQTDDDLREVLEKLAGATPDEDEEDEEEEAPAPKAKAKAKPVAKAKTSTKKRKSSEISDDELEELDIDDL